MEGTKITKLKWGKFFSWFPHKFNDSVSIWFVQVCPIGTHLMKTRMSMKWHRMTQHSMTQCYLFKWSSCSSNWDLKNLIWRKIKLITMLCSHKLFVKNGLAWFSVVWLGGHQLFNENLNETGLCSFSKMFFNPLVIVVIKLMRSQKHWCG